MSNTPQDSTSHKDIASLLDRLISEAEADGSSREDSNDRVATNASSEKSPIDGSANNAQNTVSALSSLLGGKNISDVLSNPMVQTLMSNPQLLSGLLGGLSSISQGSLPTAAVPSSERTPAGGLSGLSLDRHVALLCALKPYLNHDRQQAIEQMVNLCKIGNVLKPSPPSGK